MHCSNVISALERHPIRHDEKTIGKPWKLIAFFYYVQFSKNAYFNAIDEHKHRKAS